MGMAGYIHQRWSLALREGDHPKVWRKLKDSAIPFTRSTTNTEPKCNRSPSLFTAVIFSFPTPTSVKKTGTNQKKTTASVEAMRSKVQPYKLLCQKLLGRCDHGAIEGESWSHWLRGGKAWWNQFLGVNSNPKWKFQGELPSILLNHRIARWCCNDCHFVSKSTLKILARWGHGE